MLVRGVSCFLKSKKQETLTKTARKDTYKKHGVYNAPFILQDIQTKGNLQFALSFGVLKKVRSERKTKGGPENILNTRKSQGKNE